MKTEKFGIDELIAYHKKYNSPLENIIHNDNTLSKVCLFIELNVNPFKRFYEDHHLDTTVPMVGDGFNWTNYHWNNINFADILKTADISIIQRGITLEFSYRIPMSDTKQYFDIELHKTNSNDIHKILVMIWLNIMIRKMYTKVYPV